MEEREAHYIVEFFEGLKRNALAAYRIGNPAIFWQPGATPQSRECQIVYPVIGARSATSILAALTAHLGNQREIELCSQKRNVWIGKTHCAPSDDLKVGVHRADWAIRIWTEAGAVLPDATPFRATDVLPQREAPTQGFDTGSGYEDDGGAEEYDLEVVDGEETEDELMIDEIQQRARRISTFISEHRLAEQVFVMPILFGPSAANSFLLYSIHGISTSYSGMSLARDAMKEFTFLNAVGLSELSDEHRERGWVGKYAIQLAEIYHRTS